MRAGLFQSFLMGGFECSSHRRPDGRRLDLLDATAHDRWAAADYARLQRHGVRSVRDGVRWHRIEIRPRYYDFSSLLPMLRAAQATGTQVVWDLCHYGWPDDVDIWRPAFVERFAAFAKAVARLVRDHSDEVPVYCPVNEISYWSWAGGDHGLMGPCALGRGLELKHQLARAAMAAVRAVREIEPRARFMQADPLICAHPYSEAQREAADAYNRAQFDGWLLMSGELWPGLGGDPSLLDIVGLNYYANNQWTVGAPADDPGGGRFLADDGARATPLRQLLAMAHERLKRPLVIAETGTEINTEIVSEIDTEASNHATTEAATVATTGGDRRVAWLRHVADEVAAARASGVPVEGLCLYPVLDYPGWDDGRHCACGLYGYADDAGERPLNGALAAELARQRERVAADSAVPASASASA